MVFSGFQIQHKLLLVSHFLLLHLPSKCHGQEQSQCRKVQPKTWMQKGASKLGQLLQKSSTSVFLLPFRSALLWYVLLAFDLELQNSSSRTCLFFLSKYALCPISYHTNCRCDLSEFIRQSFDEVCILHKIIDRHQ